MGAKLLKSECVGASYDAFSDITGKYYRKFYNKMVALFTRPGLISLDEANLAPFKSFNGDVYMGEAEAMGENAATLAAKEAVFKAKAKKLTKSKNILVHALRVTVFARLHYDGERFDEYAKKLYRLLRETPKDKLPGLDNCPEYQELYDSARENDDRWWFYETIDVVSFDLSMEERNPRRFTPTPGMEDMPELIMEEILTGIRPTQI